MSERVRHWETRLVLNRPGQEGGQAYAQVLIGGPQPPTTQPGACACALCKDRPK